MIGKQILHYKIIEKLGEGGMGVVYKAEDTNLKREVAIKFLPGRIAANDEEKKRFKIEAQAAAALNHPNIAHIYAIEEANDEIFIAMEYIDGKELKEIIKSQIPNPKSAIDYATQIAEGLRAAHKKGIVHRDIKSTNIMVTEDGKIKIMDFGLAKIGSGAQLTKEQSTLGTAAYMSPEQTRGESVDHRSDIWSFGVLLYEMVTSKMPFRGDYEQAIIYSILNEAPEAIADVPLELEQIVLKALAKNPNDRYQSADELAVDLQAIGSGQSVKVKTIANQVKLRYWITATAVVLMVIAFFLFKPPSQPVPEKESIKTIAVLPFLDLSPNKDHEYFSDGLSGELINVLAKNRNLRVIARTSSFSFKGKDADIKTIAARLNVKNILEGSVQKSGNNLRIMADLVNGEDNATLWSNTYNGTMENIFALQDSISYSVAKALNATLMGENRSVPEQKTDPEAYDDYLLGNHFYILRGKENFEKAAGYYENALSIDSSYAPAWVNLSGIHLSQADQGYVPVDEGYRKARKEAQKALELDPNLASAYSRMGWIKMVYDWDWIGADEEYNRGLEVEPGNSGVINGAATLASILGRYDEAIKLMRRLIEINPVSSFGHFNLGYYSFFAGFIDESVAAFGKCLELYPQYPGGHMHIALDYLEKGQPDSAMSEMKKETEPIWQIYGLAIVYKSIGKKKEADDKLAKFIKEYQNGSAYQVAEIYAYRGEKDKAFEWLERAYKQRDGGLAQMKGDPLLRNIKKDPRYAAFLKKMKLPL